MSATDSKPILDLCSRQGFALSGVCKAQPSAYQRELREWLAAGFHGDMHFLEEDRALREDPSRLTCVVKPGDNRARDGYNENVLPVRSFIIVADQYGVRGDTDDSTETASDRSISQITAKHNQGKVARYARGTDYHAVMKKRLHTLSDDLRATFPHEGFVSFVDTVPLPERELASLAGLGWIGKHSLLINRTLGSWFFLGGVGTSLDLHPPTTQRIDTDHCGSCTRCIDACPTHAITDRSVEATRCISYLTIEHQGLIPREYHAAIGDWLYGCDVCQEVCPHNADLQGLRNPGTARKEYRSSRHSLPLLEILNWTHDDRTREFRGSAMKRITLDMLKRNAIIVAGNRLRSTPDQPLRARLMLLRDDPAQSALVRETAAVVLSNQAVHP
jgi:epoxyqueuosine reductase